MLFGVSGLLLLLLLNMNVTPCMYPNFNYLNMLYLQPYLFPVAAAAEVFP